MTDKDFKKIASLVADEIGKLESRTKSESELLQNVAFVVLETHRRKTASGSSKNKAASNEIAGAVRDLLQRTLKPLVARIAELERQR